MENSQSEKNLVTYLGKVIIDKPLSGGHEAWRLYEAAKLLLLEVENCKQKIKELEELLKNES